MTDIKSNKNSLFNNFDFVQCSQYKEFNCELEMTNIQRRLYFLMLHSDLSRGENETLYGWCKRIGLAKSTAFGIFSKNNTKMHDSVAEKIANSTGADKEWVQYGVGEPFSTHSGLATNKKNILDKGLLNKAFFALDQALNTTKKMMSSRDRSDFIAMLYKSLDENSDINEVTLSDCIFTLEEALKLKRQVMSLKAKSDLIFVIYELYSGKASYKNEMQNVIEQLIRS